MATIRNSSVLCKEKMELIVGTEKNVMNDVFHVTRSKSRECNVCVDLKETQRDLFGKIKRNRW